MAMSTLIQIYLKTVFSSKNAENAYVPVLHMRET